MLLLPISDLWSPPLCDLSLMSPSGITPAGHSTDAIQNTSQTPSSALFCDCDLTLIGQGKHVHAALARIGYGSDVILKNDLVDLYGKCGRMDMACDVFDKMLETNTVLWTAMMCRTMDLNLNEFRSPDPGPRDGSILRLQQQHRSREVWEADVSDIWTKYGLCSLPFVSVDWGLITALLERWRPETHMFHLRPSESTITLQDVEVLLDIPIEGKAVTGNTNLKAHDLCKHLLGEQPTEELDINGMKVKVSWLSDRFTGQVEEGADPETCCLKALNMPRVPAPYLDVALAGLMHVDVFEKFCAFNPHNTLCLRATKSWVSKVPWEQLEVVGFGASTFSHDSLVQAKRRKIDESSLGDAGGLDDEVEEEADFQDSIIGGDRKGGGEVTQSTTKTPVVAQRRSKRQRKKPRCGICKYTNFSFLFDSLASASIVELDQFNNDNVIGQNLMVPSVEIENGSCPREGGKPSKHEFEAMIIRIAEMEKLEKMETKKVLGTAISIKSPSTMMTQDTWTNLVDPSPPMPTSSHVGWDGRSEIFQGQLAMRYIVCDIFQATGHHWHIDDDFEYPLNPNMRYTPIIFREMQREYQCRLEQYEVLKFDCRTFNIPIPCCRAVDMPIDTHQLLQRALHRFREEVNRMQMRLQRHQYRFLTNERRDERLMGEARFYMEASMNEDVQSDIEMSDEDQEP
ncbi:hypothetical protein RHSIM_RhsimUnG0133300 [Rhododendron simsii]|uniref:Aminotransferase-like plant mobile domain-containing protein n=1 Tax=Rhododendron simsii TaxID=118357 RepID=A0A834L4Q3_RHOSS|nr:hypothetical protein RHSIM_RhsimUnG0133300 [Rhododendron simsii]